MKITIACVGRLKEGYLREAQTEYCKRLSRFAEIKVLEVPDEPVPERLSEAQRQQAMRREGERLLKAAGGRAPLIALCVDGGRCSSEGFAQALDGWLQAGGAEASFVIGGSLGLSGEVLEKATARVSLSDMTFPHQIARVLLLEQLYRAFKINNNETYHK